MKRSASLQKLNEVRRYDISFRNVMDVQNTNQSQTKLTTGNAEYDFLLRHDLKVLDAIDEELISTQYIRNHDGNNKDAHEDFSTFFKQRLDKQGKTFQLESVKTVEQVHDIAKAAPVIPTSE
jgi:hypothetical protein